MIMSGRPSQPHWSLFYLLMPLAGGLLWLIARDSAPVIVRRMLDIGVLLLIWGLFELWRTRNASALEHEPFDVGARRRFYHDEGGFVAQNDLSDSNVIQVELSHR
jgi:hypothetical protein